MRYHTRLLAGLIGLLAAFVMAAPAAAAAPAPAAAPAQAAAIPPAQYCDIRISVPAHWNNGYIVDIYIKNISNVPVTWSASVVIPPPGYIIQAWNVTVTVSGSTVWLRPWNPILQPGQAVNFGYVGSGPLVLPQVTCQPAAGA